MSASARDRSVSGDLGVRITCAVLFVAVSSQLCSRILDDHSQDSDFDDDIGEGGSSQAGKPGRKKNPKSVVNVLVVCRGRDHAYARVPTQLSSREARSESYRTTRVSFAETTASTLLHFMVAAQCFYTFNRSETWRQGSRSSQGARKRLLPTSKKS